jgi:hypothetical protein
MEFNFKKFEGRNVRLENKITVTRSYSIGLPSYFYKKNKIDRYRYVVFYFDKKKMTIGLRFTNDEKEENKFSVIRSSKGYGGIIVSKSFFKTYGIIPKNYYGRYEWQKYESDATGELFVIKLEKRDKVEGRKFGTGEK